MTRTKSTYLALLAVLLSPMGANADLIGAWEGTWNQGSVVGTIEMTITNQVPDKDFSVDGYFDWLCVNGAVCSGRELFTGKLVGNIFGVTGYALENDVNLGLGSYTGTVSADGNSISGTLTLLGGTRPLGNWSVTRVPEPGTLALLGIGLLGMGLARRNKKA